MKSKLLLLLATLYCFVACQETSLNNGYTFSFEDGTQTSQTIPCDQNAVSICFDAPAEWSAQVVDISTAEDASWAELLQNSGSAGQGLNITINIAENTSAASRSLKASIVCNDQTLSVLIKQSGADNTGLEITSDTELTAEANYDYVNPFRLDFTASSSWIITVRDESDADPAWLTMEKYSGSAGEYSLEIMLADNTTINSRSAKIAVESNSLSDTVYITQLGATPYELKMSVVETTAGVIRVEVDPGDYTGIYYVTRYNTADYETYNYTPETFTQALLDKYINYGYDMTTPNGYALFQGKQTVDLSIGYWLYEETPYTIFAVGITGKNAVINSNVATASTTTKAITYNTELSFEYSTGEIWLDWAEVTAKPSEDGVEFFMGVDWLNKLDFESSYAWYTDEEDFMEQMVSMAGLNRSDYVHTSEYSTTWSDLSGDDEFMIFTFAIDGNLACSELHYGTFWTFDGMMDLYGYHIDIEQSYTTTQDVFINMDPGNYSGVYYLGMYPYESYDGDAEKLARALIEFEMNYEEVEDFTLANDIRYFKGAKQNASLYEAWNGIMPGWSYIVLVFGINPDTTVPTDISTMMVVAGEGYGAPQSLSAQQNPQLTELVKFVEGRNNGEALVQSIMKRTGYHSRTVQSVSDPIGKSLLMQAHY